VQHLCPARSLQARVPSEKRDTVRSSAARSSPDADNTVLGLNALTRRNRSTSMLGASTQRELALKLAIFITTSVDETAEAKLGGRGT